MDILQAAGFDVMEEDLRLWLYNEQDKESGDDLEARCRAVSKGIQQTQQKPEFQNEDIELNSGIDFPGQCLEPLMKSALRLNSLTLARS